jgi:hypothetical protein
LTATASFTWARDSRLTYQPKNEWHGARDNDANISVHIRIWRSFKIAVIALVLPLIHSLAQENG